MSPWIGWVAGAAPWIPAFLFARHVWEKKKALDAERLELTAECNAIAESWAEIEKLGKLTVRLAGRARAAALNTGAARERPQNPLRN